MDLTSRSALFSPCLNTTSPVGAYLEACKDDIIKNNNNIFCCLTAFIV